MNKNAHTAGIVVTTGVAAGAGNVNLLAGRSVEENPAKSWTGTIRF